MPPNNHIPGSQDMGTSVPEVPQTNTRAVPEVPQSVLRALGGSRVARVIQNAPNPSRTDPAFNSRGMPPNFGQFPVPHTMTMQGLVATASKAYRISDEALQNSFDNARFMELDVGIWECIEGRARASALLDWSIECEDDKSSEQVALVQKMTKIIDRCWRFMQFRESLVKWGTWNGRAANQIRYRWQDYGGEDYVTPTKWKPINGDKLVFRLDDGKLDVDPDQIGIRVGMTYKPGSKISGRWVVEPTDRSMAYFLQPWERDAVVLHQHQIEDAAYERPQDAGKINGVGIRHRIYWEWFQKQEALAWLMEFLERSAFGINLWYYPMGNPQAKVDTETAINNRVGNDKNNIMVPVPPDETAHQYGVEHVPNDLAGGQMILDMLDKYFGGRIKRLILGQVMTTEGGSSGLGSDLPTVLLGTFRDIVEYDSINLDETLTTDLVRKIQIWNFPKSGHIRLKFKTHTQEVNLEERLNAMKTAWEMFARIKEKSVLDAIGESVPTASDRVLPPPQSGKGESAGPGQGVDEMGRGQEGTTHDPRNVSDEQTIGRIKARLHGMGGAFGSPALNGKAAV